MSKNSDAPQTPGPIRVFFDARFTRTTHHDGISRYGSCLLTALLEATAGTDIEVTAIISDEAQLGLLPECTWVKLNSPTSPAEVGIAKSLNDLGADVVFSTMQVMGSMGRRYGSSSPSTTSSTTPIPCRRPTCPPPCVCCGASTTSATPRSVSCSTGPMPWQR